MYEIYQIQYGDTIDTIAGRIGSTVDELKKLNKEISVVPGKYIIIPTQSNNLFDVYIVKSGDNLYEIAKKYGIGVDELVALNGLNKGDYLYPKQQLIVPSSDVEFYITKKGDTLEYVLSSLNSDYGTVSKQNDKLYLMPDQLIVLRREEN